MLLQQSFGPRPACGHRFTCTRRRSLPARNYWRRASGGCGNVQNSEYSYLFGIIPVALLGVVGYLSIAAAWLLYEFGPKSARKLAALAMWVRSEYTTGLGILPRSFQLSMSYTF